MLERWLAKDKMLINLMSFGTSRLCAVVFCRSIGTGYTNVPESKDPYRLIITLRTRV
jgi:hypothetical protein